MGKSNGKNADDLVAADIRPYFGDERMPQRYAMYLALIGMPSAAAGIVARHDIHFNPRTLRRWRATGGRLGVLAVLISERCCG